MATAEDEVKKRVDKLEGRVTTLEQQVSNVILKLDMFITESRENRARQDEDMREIRADIKDLHSKIDSTVKGMFITVALGIGAMVVAVLLK